MLAIHICLQHIHMIGIVLCALYTLFDIGEVIVLDICNLFVVDEEM